MELFYNRSLRSHIFKRFYHLTSIILKEKEETVSILFKDSTIRGIKLKSYNGKDFYGFLGIPYAKPPVGDLRFMPPQPVEKYPKEIDATRYREFSLQRRHIHGTDNIGSEDCLYMNIFTPQLPSINQKPKAILISIYGGGLVRGRTHWVQPYPYTLMEYDIIYVTFVYRLHILGFLNLGLSECPGNMGFKDQVEAIKWIVSNISHFGGDPHNITLHGTSSGASSIILLTMSPLSKSLFQRVITASPVALYPWIMEDNAEEIAFKFGRTLGFEGTDKRKLLKFYKSQPAEKLFNAIYENQNTEFLTEAQILWGTYMFRASIESIKEEAFLPEPPFKLWDNVNSIDILFGCCSQEGTSFQCSQETLSKIINVDYVRNILKILVQGGFPFLSEDEISKIYEEVIQFYYGGGNKFGKNDFEIAMAFFSDYLLKDNYSLYNCLRKPGIEKSFIYLFSYDGNLNVSKNVWGRRFPEVILEGAYHSDEHGYFIETPQKCENGIPNEEDLKIIRYTTTLFTNFVKTGNPNGNGLDCSWKPSSPNDPCYLQIDSDLKLIKNELFEERAKFWNYLVRKYSKHWFTDPAKL